MNIPLACAQQITENNSDLAAPVLKMLLWTATTPNVTESSDYDEALDFLAAKLPGFREWRNEKLKEYAA